MGQAKERKEEGNYPVKDWKSPSLVMRLASMTQNTAVIEAVLNPEFGKPGMTLKQKIKAAERIHDSLEAQNGIKNPKDVVVEITDVVQKAGEIKDGEAK